MQYEVVIIGAGLSGLAAGMRLAHFGKRVLILEAHTTPGGLNSYYRRRGRIFDVGLHALTNYTPAAARGTPLTKLCRQLRLRHEDLHLVPQCGSRIVFPGAEVRFANDFADFRRQLVARFPDQAAGLDRLTARLAAYDEIALDPPVLSARQEVAAHLTDPLLRDLLAIPLMYYGNPCQDDMDFTLYAILWKSIYQAGFARPAGGMRPVIELLVERYRQAGGELRLGTAARRLLVRNGRVEALELATGETIAAAQVLSSAGLVETLRLCDDQPPDSRADQIGPLSFVELLALLDVAPATLGLRDTLIFFCDTASLAFRDPGALVGDTSGVICCPDNFQYPQPPAHCLVRVTARASYSCWRDLLGGDDPAAATTAERAAYAAAKQQVTATLLAAAVRHVPDFRAHVVFTDLFTPLTIRRFTGHLGGAVYGTPVKSRRGLTPVRNLFLCGTDQGFHGIVGAMLSGISMANLHCLSATGGEAP